MELLDSNKYPEYYTKVYGTYLKVYNFEAEDSWLESNVAELFSSFNQDIQLRILSIGSGPGTNILQIFFINGTKQLHKELFLGF